MTDPDALAYVTAAAPLVGLELSAARLAEVAVVFAQMQGFAAPALAFAVPDEVRPAAAFTP